MTVLDSDKNELAMKVATFRFGVIADFVTGGRLAYGDKARLLTEKVERVYEIPGSTKTRISRATIWVWVNTYRSGGCRIEALAPKVRRDQGNYPTLSTTVRMAIKGLKEENAYYTVPVIIKKLRLAKIIGADEVVNKASIYRFLRKEKLLRPSDPTDDRRRFEATHSNAIWQCDILHGPLAFFEALKSAKKAYLMAIIDDHSRLIVHAEFYPTETFETLKLALCEAVARRGIPQKFYVDNGACYRSEQLERILASLGTALSHSPPYRPQGRGKIERWFKNIRDSFLPLLPETPLAIADLNDRLSAFVDEYNNSVHSAIKETPYERYRRDLSCIRPAPAHLLDFFRRREYRRVKKDRTVQLNARIFEVAPGLIDRTVELFYHERSPDDVEVFHQGLSHGKAVALNPGINARGGRDFRTAKEAKPIKAKPKDLAKEPDGSPATKAGTLFDPVVAAKSGETI